MRKICMSLPFVIFSMISCQPSSTEADQPKDSTAVSSRSDTGVSPSVSDTTSAKDSLPSTQEPNWVVAGIDDAASFKSFFDTFKNWVNAEQQDSIIAHTAFPLKNYKNAKALKTNFSSVFDQQMKDVVSKQTVHTLFVNANGVMVGNGELWMNYLKGSYYITAINK